MGRNDEDIRRLISAWKPLISVIAVVGILAVVAVWTVKTPKNAMDDQEISSPQSPSDTVNEPLLQVDLQNPKITEYYEGKVIWTISAQSVERNSNKDIIEFLNIRGEFFDSQQNPTMTFFAKQVTLDLESRSFTISGGIGLENKELDTYISAQEARWRPAEKTLIGFGDPIVLSKDGIEVTGRNMEIDVEMKLLSLEGNVRIKLPADILTESAM